MAKFVLVTDRDPAINIRKGWGEKEGPTLSTYYVPRAVTDTDKECVMCIRMFQFPIF